MLPRPIEVAVRTILAGPPSRWDRDVLDLQQQHPDLAGAIAERAEAVKRRLAEGRAVGADAPNGSLVDHVPERIGGYEILGVLGEGGMGTVYLAEQKEPIRRRVAIKVVKLGMDSKAVLARFEVERQALAVMNHECIAKVFEAGTTATGQPYFVMEHVEGIPIDEYCDRHRLTVRERIALFQDVCAGVQHAHQKGVIHRDLKPANVLVVARGDRAAPKIIDFGLARATDHQLVAQTVYTEHGQIMGTPEYMSPEQAGFDAQGVDTRTDVYSLGVMLYGLLSGELPFSSRELRAAGLLEVQRRIREDEPLRPSTKLSSTVDGGSRSAANRRTTAHALSRDLRGDLDWIVMMAMAKEPERRYGSAAELAADLDRHVRHEPVLAGPPSATYRVAKLMRKHRGAVAAGALVFVTMIAAIVGVSLSRARIGEALAETVRRRDESTLRHAAAEMRSDPTRAIGLLRDLSPHHHLANEAWSLAHQAKENGVAAWLAEGDDVVAFAWSPVRATVAYGGEDGSIRVFDFDTGARSAFDGRGGCVTGMVWSPDGRQLAWGSQDRVVRTSPLALWTPRELTGHVAPPTRLRWSPDGAWLASGAAGDRVIAWNPAAGSVWEHPANVLAFEWSLHDTALAVAGEPWVTIWSPHGTTRLGDFDAASSQQAGRSTALSWDPTANRIAVGDDTGDVRIHDLASGRQTRGRRHREADGPIMELAWSPDGARIACRRLIGTRDSFTIGQKRLSFLGPDGNLDGAIEDGDFSTDFAWSPDGTQLVLGKGAGVAVAELANHVVRDRRLSYMESSKRQLSGHRGLRSAGWSSDGAWLATLGREGALRIWSNRTTTDRRFPVKVRALAWTRGNLLEVADEGALHRWDPVGSGVTRVLEGPAELTATAWAANGDRFAFATAGRQLGIKIRDLAVSVVDVDVPLVDLAWSPDGSSLAADAGAAVLVWRGTPSRANGPVRVPRSGPQIRAFRWTGDSRRLAWVDRSGAVSIWSADNGSPTGLPLAGRSVNDCSWDPAGNDLALACRDGAIVRYDARSGELLPVQVHERYADAVVWSPDGRMLASLGNDFTVRIRKFPAESIRLPIDGAPRQLLFSPDGTKLLTRTSEATYVWDVVTWRHVELGRMSSFVAPAWSHDGRMLALAQSDWVRVWIDDVPRDAALLGEWLRSLSNAVTGRGGSVVGEVRR